MLIPLFVALLAANPVSQAQAPLLPVTLTIAPAAGSPEALVFRITNHGSEPLDLLAHRGLLSLEIQPEGRRRPTRCAAPPGFVPREVDPALIAVLAAGATYSEQVDIRMYCWGKRLEPLLGAGARVRARYGYRRASARTWTAQTENGRTRLAFLESEEVALPPLPVAPTPPEGPMRLEVRPSHVSSGDGRHMPITVLVKNTGSIPVRIFVHPALFHFDVTGPGGTVNCGLGDLGQTALRQSFRLLPPGRQASESLDLGEYCPSDTFSRPGVYEVSSSFEATDDGGSMALHAFTGTVVGNTVEVRIALGRRVGYELEVPEVTP
jgi:hypothetical protein